MVAEIPPGDLARQETEFLAAHVSLGFVIAGFEIDLDQTRQCPSMSRRSDGLWLAVIVTRQNRPHHFAVNPQRPERSVHYSMKAPVRAYPTPGALASMRPTQSNSTAETEYPRARKHCPTRFRFRSLITGGSQSFT